MPNAATCRGRTPRPWNEQEAGPRRGHEPARAPPVSATPETPYRADIDGLRAVAVLAVVAYHAFPGAVPGGFVGVDVFFVISGYLITSILLRGMAGRGFSFHGFYVRRARRLFPALAVVLASCMVAGWFLLAPADYAALGRHGVASALFVANLVFWRETDYFAAAADSLPLLHLWSLGIEEQFYLLWPAALVLARRAGIDTLRLTLGAGLASLVAALWLTPPDPAAAFYLPFTRFWELLAGGVVAHLHVAAATSTPARPSRRPDVAAWAGLALVLAAVLALDDQSPFPGWRALPPVAGAVLLVAAGAGTRVARLLSMRVLVWVGLVSYPLYLWHWPLLSFARIDAAGEVAAPVRWLLVAASLGLAAATWALVERPLRWRLAPRPALALLAGGMSVVVIAGCGLVVSNGVPARAGDPVRDLAAYRYDFRTASREGTCSLTGAPGQPLHFPDTCVDPPRAGAGAFVVLWGDSHAAMLYPGLRAAGGPGLRIAQFTRSGCRPFLDSPNAACNRSNADVLRRIAAEPPDYVVLFAHWNHLKFTTAADLLSDLEPTLAALERLGTRTIVVGPAPRWQGTLPANMVRLHAERPFLRLPAYTDYRLDPAPLVLDGYLRAQLAGRDAVTYVSAIDRMCNARGCMTHVGDPAVPTTWDYGHLTGPAATFLATAIAGRTAAFAPPPARAPGADASGPRARPSPQGATP